MDDQSILATALIGRYDIEREIGRGGMATVYLARDVRHDRRVALKLLNPELGAVLGAERFLSEIRVTANLQHPNLLPLFDSGEANGLLFYVMPYVDGESLRARLTREKQLPIDEAVRLTVAIANALDYAHRHGVVHRDLKPENILLQDGQPLVADFGIALAVSNAGGARVTQTGLSLGTPQYMSPEQATGDRNIDGRTDIYSLGAVAYEMLTGEPPHTGATAQAIIARLMTEEPRALTDTRRSVPPQVDAAVRCSLEKLPADRFGTAKEFADALQGRSTPALEKTHLGAARIERRRQMLPWAIAAVTSFAAIAGGVAWWRGRDVPPASVTRFMVDLPAGVRINDRPAGLNIALSRDGEMLAYVAGNDDQLYLRRLDQLSATPLPNAGSHFNDLRFSGDNKWIGFKTADGFGKFPVSLGESGAQPTTLLDGSPWNGIAWTYGTEMVYALGDTLWRITNSGAKRMIAAADHRVDQYWHNPFVFPDGRSIGFRLTPLGGPAGGYATGAARLGIVSVDGGPRAAVDVEFQNVVGYADGILVFGRTGGRILAARFDEGARKVVGEPLSLVDNVKFKPTSGVQAVMSDNGTLAYLTGADATRLDVIDESGKVSATVSGIQGRATQPTWSPDGKRLAFVLTTDPKSDIWVYDTDTKVTSRITQRGDAISVSWTPDGKRIGFGINSLGRPAPAYWVAADGSGVPQEIPGTRGLGIVRSVNFSRDGKFVIARTAVGGPAAGRAETQLREIALAGGAPVVVPASLKLITSFSLSPNGKWFAYSSNETGREEVYVRPFPSGEGQLQVSVNGGLAPRWSPDGKRLWYRTTGPLRFTTLDISGAMPKILGSDSLTAGELHDVGPVSYDVHPDGRHLAVIRDAGDGARLVVVTNWLQEVKAKLKASR